MHSIIIRISTEPLFSVQEVIRLEDEWDESFTAARELVTERFFVPVMTVGCARSHEADEDEGEEEGGRGEGGGDDILDGEVGEDRQRVEGGEGEREPFEPY